MPKRMPPTEILLAVGYGLGVVGSLWDWRQHLAGIIAQPPHLTIDAGGLLVIAVLAFADRRGQGSTAFFAAYLLLVLVGLIFLGPFGLMMFAPHTGFTAASCAGR